MLSPKATSSMTATLVSLLFLDFAQAQVQQSQLPNTYLNHTSLSATEGPTYFPPCDALINSNLSHVVHMPSSPIYPKLVNATWNPSTQRAPWCFVSPSTTDEVSRVLSTLYDAGNGAGQWAIAIRSGGHGSHESNNIKEGVTIDLSQLNATTYDKGKNIAGVGTGARWINVYEALEKEGVSVTGGREGVVGVGGFMIGGGNSWYTPKTGFACDSVVNYELVTSKGVVINANASVHADLWKALKGGGSNFGIVTRFDLEAFPAGNLTMQTRAFAYEHSDAFCDAVAKFTDLDQSFADNSMITVVSYDAKNGLALSVQEVNTANQWNTTAFSAFDQIPTSTAPVKKSVTLAESAKTSSLPPDSLNAGFPLTFANDPRVMKFCIAQHTALVHDLNTTLGPQAFATYLNFQPLPAYVSTVSTKKGGNVLGLERSPRNKIIFIAAASLVGPNKAQQHPVVYQKMGAMIRRIRAYAESVGAGEEFVYANYADTAQDTLGSYGKVNVGLMRNASLRYDPHQFFQDRVPGGFKISRVN